MSGEGYSPLFVRDGHAEAWRPWFAWRPVWVADLRWPYPRQRRVWWQFVLRRKFHAASWFLDGCTWWWQYAWLDFSTADSTENQVENTT